MLTALARLAAVLALIVLAGVPARAEIGPDQKNEIEQIVRDYLVANPEVIEEALNALRVKKERESVAAQAKAIQDNRDLIFNSPNQTVIGNPQGPITLVEFLDYNCGYCKRAMADTMALLDANKDLRIVIKEFPILSPGSVEAARVAVAVKDHAPQKYLEFHQQLFERPGQADGEKALGIARDLGLDTAVLQSAANRDEVTRNLQEVQSLAQTLGISGTPSYVIGEELVPGAAGFDALQEKVAAMRKCGATNC